MRSYSAYRFRRPQQVSLKGPDISLIRQAAGPERSKLKKKLAVLLVSIITAAVVLSGCGIIDGGAKTKFSDRYFDVFDTVVSVTAYCKDRKGFDAVNTELHDTLKHYHQLFDIYNEYDGMNNAATINKLAGTGELTEVEPALAELIEYTRSMYVLTNGKVNAAMGAVLSLWHEARTLSLDEPAKAYILPLRTLRTPRSTAAWTACSWMCRIPACVLMIRT